MSRARVAVLHAGLIQRLAAAREPQPLCGAMPAVQPLSSAPVAHEQPAWQFEPSAGTGATWVPPTVVPFRPAEHSPQPPVKPKRKAMTLRLEPVRHGRLRAASAELRRSCQSILVEALEDWLAKTERRGEP